MRAVKRIIFVGLVVGLLPNPALPAKTFTNSASFEFDTAGYSYYDINANHRNARQIALSSNGNVAVAFTKTSSPTFTQRDVRATLWRSASSEPDSVVFERKMQADSTVGRGGFCGVTYLPKDGRIVINYHHANDPLGTFFVVEKTAGNFDWDNEFAAPDSIAGDADPGIWPTAAGGMLIDIGEDLDGDGDTSDDTIEVIHFFSNQRDLGGSLDHQTYGRMVDSASSPTVWKAVGFPHPNIGLVVDSNERISPTVVASHKSPRVALIYTEQRDCGYSTACSDIVYKESMNGGQDWVTAGSFAGFQPSYIADYAYASTTRPTGDLMGVYDENDSLVVSWNQWVSFEIATGGISSQADIYVWTKQWGIRKAVDGNFTNMPTGVQIPDVRRQTLNFPHIAVHDGTGDPEKKNYYYLTFLQYGGNSAPEYSDTSDDGFLNGEIYACVSTNQGYTWSPPLNLTQSRTPGCTKGNCAGVSFSSCAERANDTIHIAYMGDTYSGSVAAGDHGAAFATNNPIVYMKVPAFDDDFSWRGDANFDHIFTLADIVATLNYMFNRPGWPACLTPCGDGPICWLSGLECLGDWNRDGLVGIGDMIVAVNFIFSKPCGTMPPGCWDPRQFNVCYLSSGCP